MFFGVIILSVLVALARKGSITRLGELTFKAAPTLVTGVVLRMLLSAAGGRVLLPPVLASGVYLVSYGCVLYAVYANRCLPGLPLTGAGTLMNALVIFANGARMPISVEALERVGLLGEAERIAHSYTHQLMGPGARLWWLADVVTFRPVLSNVFSIGDGFIALGLFLAIYSSMTRRQ